MIGAEPPQLQHKASQAGAPVLAVQGLSLPRQDQFGVDLEDIAFDVRAGEIVGVAGVSGNGQQELLAALSGEDRRAAPGSITLFGKPIGDHSPRHRRKEGLYFVPEERLGRGAVPTLSLAQNTLLTRTAAVSRSGWVRTRQVAELAEHIIARFQVKAGGPDAAAKSLSGGNLQKFIVGREIDAAPTLLIVSQPTWGVDVGAAALIRGELLAAARRRLRAAGGERGTRRTVRDQRPPDRHRPGPHVTVGAHGRGDDRTHRRMDERPVEPGGASMLRLGGAGPLEALAGHGAGVAADRAGAHRADGRARCSWPWARTRCAGWRCSSSSRSTACAR